MLDLNDIALFIQIVRSGSFAAAGRHLGVPGNTVSRRIQGLEAQLGVRLLQRSTRKLTLTGAGQAFHERCESAVGGLIDAGRDLMAGGTEPGGLVRVAAPADFLDVFRIEWVSEFMTLYPRVRLDFVLSDTHADLIAERIDVAFRGGPLADLGYVRREIVREENHRLVASPAYIAARGNPVVLQDLRKHECLSFPGPHGRMTWRLVGPDGLEETVEVTARFSGNTAQSIRRAALVGLGITLLPYAIIRADLQAGLLVTVLPHYHYRGFAFSVLYPSRRHLAPAVAAFIELVAEKLNYCNEAPPQHFE